MGSWQGGNWVWNFVWIRKLNAREIDMVGKLTDILCSQNFAEQEADSWRWIGAADGRFTTKAEYNCLLAASQPSAEQQEIKAFEFYGDVRRQEDNRPSLGRF
ncbi:hypothetical protein ACS0TY_014444 [Phlomoides rotata]